MRPIFIAAYGGKNERQRIKTLSNYVSN